MGRRTSWRAEAPGVVFGDGPAVLYEQGHVVVKGRVEADEHINEKYDVDGEIEIAVPVPRAVGPDEDYIVWDLRMEQSA